MFVPFETLPNSARVWIYQSNRKLTDAEVINISDNLVNFTNDWAAHNQKLNSSFVIKYNYFIVLAVDENVVNASGCSIDSSVNTIKKIEKEYNLSFFDRTNLAFLIEDEVQIIKLNQIENEIKSKKINTRSIFFNNLAKNVKELSENWLQPAYDTWLNKYFNTI